MAKRKSGTTAVAGCTLKLAGRYYRPGEHIDPKALAAVDEDVREGLIERGALIEEIADEGGPDVASLTVDQLETLLTDAGVDLQSIEGSGADGAVVKADLVAAASAL